MSSDVALTVSSPARAEAPVSDPKGEASGGLVQPSPHVTLHIIEDQGVLFDAARQCAYAINATGTFIWCCLESGLSAEDTVGRLEQTFAITRGSAADYVDTALHNWRDRQLVAALDFAPPASESPRAPVLARDSAPRQRSDSGRAVQPDPGRRDYLL